MAGAAVPPISTADRALARAILAWGGGDFDRLAGRFSGPWRERLRSAWEVAGRESSGSAEAGLSVDHRASSRPDPARVHPSWFVRALQDESPAVRRAVVAHGPAWAREPLRVAPGIDPDEVPSRHPADPEAVSWALALWSERLVGDVPDRDDDPPVVVALTRLRPRELARLIKVCGLVKHAFATEGHGPSEFDESIARFTPLDRVRLGFFLRRIGKPDPRLIGPARVDLRAVDGDRRRAHGRLGLITIGRLLGQVEPHRARWASQHLPYPIVKLTRDRNPPDLPSRSVLTWETWVLESAWARLLAERKLAGERVAQATARMTAVAMAEGETTR